MSNKTIESIKKRKAKGDLRFGDYTRDYYELHVVRLLRAAGCNPVSHNRLGVLYAWLIPGSLYKYPVYLKGNGDVHLHKDLYAFYWNLESRERHGLPQNPVPVARSHAPEAEHYDHTDPVLPLHTVDFEVSPDELSSFKLPRRTDG